MNDFRHVLWKKDDKQQKSKIICSILSKVVLNIIYYIYENNSF